MLDTQDIFVCGHRKSGTSLLINLLDSHSQLAVCPFDLTIFYGYFPDEDRFRSDEKIARLQKVIFDNWINHMSATKYFDVARMESDFFELCQQKYDIKTVFHALINSFQNVTDQADRKYRVSKETSLEMHAIKVNEITPNCKFIHVVRNPLDNFASLLSGLDGYYSNFEDSYLSLLHSLIDRVGLGLRCGLENMAYFGSDRYLFVRYEDIVLDTKNSLSNISNFIGVKFDEITLKPSIIGFETPGNSFVNRQQYEVSRGRIGTYKKLLDKNTSSFINLNLSEVMDKLGYAEDIKVDQETLNFASKYYDYVNKRCHFYDRFTTDG